MELPLWHDPTRLWRVVEGSGQGLLHSGDVADVALYVKSEASWATVDNVKKQHNIIDYMRYRDDVLIIAYAHTKRGREPVREFFWELKRRSGYFDLKKLRKSVRSV